MTIGMLKNTGLGHVLSPGRGTRRKRIVPDERRNPGARAHCILSCKDPRWKLGCDDRRNCNGEGSTSNANEKVDHLQLL